MNDVDNSQDIIDSRDVIARIDELESDIEGYEQDIEEANDDIDEKETEIEDLEDRLGDLDEDEDEDEIETTENEIDSLRVDIVDLESHIEQIKYDIEEAKEELAPLQSLAEDAEGYAPDWNYGATLIRNDYFVEYARELVIEIGDLPSDIPSYIENNIDWDGVADDIQMDYTCVDFDGVDYWIR